MVSEIRNRHFLLFVLRVFIAAVLILGVIVGMNYFVDASQVITSRGQDQMAELVLAGNIVAVPENYNERVYQMALLERMKEMPSTIVLGSSRGTYLSKEVTGYPNLFNHCVSGACIEDYYAIPELYAEKFGKYPDRVIMEISPWVLNEYNPELRWIEIFSYRSTIEKLYEKLNGRKPEAKNEIGDTNPFEVDGKPFYSKESPWFSLPYFQYNCYVLSQKGLDALNGNPAQISTDPDEAAELPDGSVRNPADQENPNLRRLAQVKSETGAVTFEYAHRMTEVGVKESTALEALIKELQDHGAEIILFLAPFSPTQCTYSFDQDLNPGFRLAEEYLRDLTEKKEIRLIGGYDSRAFGLTDEQYIDYSHPDKSAIKTVWESAIAAF